MKTIFPTTFALGLLTLALHAQSYSIDWFNIAVGGGVSTGGQYSLNGTTGQPDASGPMTGGSYSVTGGFWSLIAAAPNARPPNLAVLLFSPKSVVVSWPDTGSYTLLESSTLADRSWRTNTSPVTTLNGTNSITIASPRGNLFFRLSQP